MRKFIVLLVVVLLGCNSVGKVSFDRDTIFSFTDIEYDIYRLILNETHRSLDEEIILNERKELNERKYNYNITLVEFTQITLQYIIEKKLSKNELLMLLENNNDYKQGNYKKVLFYIDNYILDRGDVTIDKNANNGKELLLTIGILMPCFIINEFTNIPSYNNNISLAENIKIERNTLLYSFGKEYEDIINNFLQKNINKYSLAGFIDNKRIIGSDDYKINNQNYSGIISKSELMSMGFNDEIISKSDIRQIRYNYYGTFTLSRIGLNKDNTIAIIQLQYNKIIYYYLLEKTNKKWEIKDKMSRRK